MRTIDWTALGTWAMALLTGVTLFYLKRYVADTAKLARTTADQLEAIQRPLLVFYEDESRRALFIKNVGTAVALNVRWNRTRVSGELLPMFQSYLEPFAPKPEIQLETWSVLKEQSLVEVTYESPSARTYITVGKIHSDPESEARSIHLEFGELENRKKVGRNPI